MYVGLPCHCRSVRAELRRMLLFDDVTTCFMKPRYLLVNIMFPCAACLQAQTEVAVAKFKGDRPAAVSYTFDDGLLEHYTELYPRLNEYGIKGTFCVNGKITDRYEQLIAAGDTSDVLVREKPRMTWKMLREMSDAGHEITSHGWAHVNVNRLEGEALRYEGQHNDTVIWKHTGRFPRTYFYPGNAKSPEKVKYCEFGRVGSRVEQVSIGSKRDEAWLRNWVALLIRDRKWGVGMTHGISYGYDHFSDLRILWNHLAYVGSLRDSVWVGTFHDVSAYVKERDAVRLKVRERGDEITVRPSLPLDREIFSEPLTMIVGRVVVSARQDGRNLDVIVRGDSSLIDFNPGGGPVCIKVSGSANK